MLRFCHLVGRNRTWDTSFSIEKGVAEKKLDGTVIVHDQNGKVAAILQKSFLLGAGLAVAVAVIGAGAASVGGGYTCGKAAIGR